MVGKRSATQSLPGPLSGSVHPRVDHVTMVHTPRSVGVQRAAANRSVEEGVWRGLDCVDRGTYSHTQDRDLHLHSCSESHKC